MANPNPLAFIFFATLGLVGCAGAPEGEASAQQIVERIAGKHADVVRLTLHAVPRGKTGLEMVASTAAARVGRPSDPEDAKAIETGEEVVLQEGDNLDVTIALADAAGKRTAATGVTLRMGEKLREQVLAEARAVAAELASAVALAKQPLW